MFTEEKIDSVVRQLFKNIQFNDEPKGIYEPLRYTMSIGGKRIRPRLCITTYSLYKDDLNDSILQPAAGIEVFHNFTLLHDDIMDNSPLRRGMDTVWKKWNKDTAILSGDVMCIDSYSRICKAPSEVLLKVIELFNRTAAQVCEGQQYDMDFERVESVSMDDYMKMIGLKTGVLIACSSKMGALIAGAKEEDCDNLYWYGYYLGQAFQVTDDYLDTYGDEQILGKPVGGDIINCKKNWLLNRAIEKADSKDRNALLNLINKPADTEEEKSRKINEVKTIYSKLCIIDDAKYKISDLNKKALEYAEESCKGLKFEILKRFAENLVGRSK